jgi:hypothetical protein
VTGELKLELESLIELDILEEALRKYQGHPNLRSVDNGPEILKRLQSRMAANYRAYVARENGRKPR